jgi:hypothetical protein
MQKAILVVIKKPGTNEAIVWLLVLCFFAFSTPQIGQHFTLCVFHWLGFTHCPGCGIGRSISFFLHGDIATSWQMHYLGIPATFFLLFRTLNILHKNYIKPLKTKLL